MFIGVKSRGGSGGGSGSDNLRTVADITARDALTHTIDEIVQVLDASGDPTVTSGMAWYQYNGSSYDKIAEGEDNDYVAYVDGKVIAYNSTSVASLESTHPASSNSGRLALVNVGDNTSGLYRSNGTSWVKELDYSGDIDTLFNYGTSISFTGLDDLGSASGTVKWTESNGSTDVTGFNGALANVFDDVYGTILYKTGVDLSTTVIWKELDSAESYGKFTIDFYNTPTSSIEDFYLVGWNGSSFVRLNITSISTNGTATRSGNLVTGVDPSISETVTITTDNLTAFEGYGVEVASTSTVGAGLREISGEISSTVDTSSDIVSAVNALARGVLLDDNPETSSSVNLEVSSKAIQFGDTSSNNVTYVLPGVGENGVRGKVFIFKVDNASNSLIIDGDGSENVGGATTQILNTLGEVMAVQCDGTEWHILWHYDPATVINDPDDLDDSLSTNKFVDSALIAKVAGIEAGAKDDQTGAEMETALDSELGHSDWKSRTIDGTDGTIQGLSNSSGSPDSIAIQTGKTLFIEVFWGVASGSTVWAKGWVKPNDSFRGMGGQTAGTSHNGTADGTNRNFIPASSSTRVYLKKNGSNYELYHDSSFGDVEVNWIWL